MLRALLFDFNGVLIDDEPIHLELFQRVFAEEGIELSEKDYYAEYLGYDDRGCFRAVLEKAGEIAADDRLFRLIARKSAYYQERIRREGFPVFAGGAELIREVADAGLMLGLVTGALRGEVEGALSQLDVRACFKVIVAAEDVRAAKPNPEGYQQALAGLNALPPLPARLLHPHEVLAIEDSPAGIQAASAVGLLTLGVAQTYDREELGSADRVVGSLDGLTLARIMAMFGE